jgi:hypothetical protein
MQMKFAHRCLATAMLLCSIIVPPVAAPLAAPHSVGIDIFLRFIQHIQRQAETDKQAFATASQCMNWFYKQQRQRPAPPAVQRIAWTEQTESPWSAADSSEQEAADCRARYPEGIDAVRTDFQRTQALLSLSLTFYEFALVGDGDDNSAYNSRELRDILIALDLSTEPSLGAAAHLLALTSKFDTLHNARGMEALMAGMGKLYDQGYRVTPADKARLNQVME